MTVARQQTIDLTRLSLSPGGGTRLELELDPGDVSLGGDEYSLGDRAVEARLEVSRTLAGYALRLRFAGELQGPCVRCLEPAGLELAVDAREVDQPGSGDQELVSPYVTDGLLDLGAWAHDALVLSLPAQVLCRADCPGLCAICGEPLAGADPEAHDHPSVPDPRWAKLRELQ